MKNFFSPIIFFFLTTSCSSQKIAPGKYIYTHNNSYFEIDKDNNYYFSTNSDVHGIYMFSKGKAILKGNEVNFIPDSSYFFHISVLKYYFDTTIKKNRKIILIDPENQLSEYEINFNTGSSKSVQNFDSNYSIIYEPSFQDGSIVLKASLKDSVVMLPRLLYDTIYSNKIYFSDINEDDADYKPWNVLELKIKIKGNMFAFTTLPPYILKGKQLIEKNYPVYELSQQ